MLQEVWPGGKKKKDKEKAKNIEQISTFKAGMRPTNRHRAEEEREEELGVWYCAFFHQTNAA